jgi:DNA-binding LacI/PurR family transcriptional regulator
MIMVKSKIKRLLIKILPGERTTMRVGITTIAKMLNLSPSTASRVINGKGNFSEETRKKVMDAVKEMNYIPNSIARKLQQKETKLIGVIIPDITETFFASVIKGIEEVLSEKGYSIFLCNTNENADKERKYVDLLYENRVDGIIVATVRNNIASDDILFNGNIPFIFIDNTPNEGNQFNSVTTDNFLAGKMAADYLISKGHTKIAAIMGKQDETTGRKRFEGFLKGLEENSISKDESLYKFCDFKEASGCRAMEELIEQKGFTAVFIASSKMVYGALWAVKKAGLVVPDDISIIGFDIIDKYQVISPGITSVIQLEDEIGKSSAKLLIEKIKNKEDKLYHQLYMEPKIIERESVKNIM